MEWMDGDVVAAIGWSVLGLVAVIGLSGNDGFRNMKQWDESPEGESE